MGTWFVVLELTYLSLFYTLVYHLIELLFTFFIHFPHGLSCMSNQSFPFALAFTQYDTFMFCHLSLVLIVVGFDHSFIANVTFFIHEKGMKRRIGNDEGLVRT